ncbi:hypothetical protein TL16_g03829 [Triparma laevis f. inornata]|uniref:Uncharacterized protein n=1 Tax=Triparma laevis f. inornata TaxID=1714386 RepID=A0A9W7E3H0_9STRA|nr:hypothetical protein TL16_g03829 [Triparma laevis f. inornata]
MDPSSFAIRCPACGSAHPNPALCETYRYCQNCSSVMREASSIDMKKIPKPAGRLLVIAASYGHPDDASKAIDVRGTLQKKIEGYGAKDCLNITPQDDLLKYFGLKQGPCGGKKCIRVRFLIEGRRSETIAFEGSHEFHLDNVGLFIVVPKSPPTLILGKCWYGHPRGLIKGRGAFDVTEILQARVEESGGTFLEVNHRENLKELFGDPCPNRRKNLVINYEIHGSSGSLKGEEVEGHLKKTIDLSYTPVIAPLIVIEKATYGLTEEGIKSKISDIQIELYTLSAIANRKSLGLPISIEDNSKLLNENGGLRIPHLQKKLEAANTLKEGFVDVSKIIQQRVEDSGGGKIDIGSDEDLNVLFGVNPNPGSPKQLRISYTVLGHDSERMTHSNEITYPSGFPRNYIMPRQDNHVAEAVERVEKVEEGELDDDLEAEKKNEKGELELFLSTLEITQGFYGKIGNYKKVFDVTSELRQLSFLQGGNKLTIKDTDQLALLFRDPARGVRKALQLAYTIRGFSGTMRIEEVSDFLKSSIQIGYIPQKGTVGANRRESRKMSLTAAAGGAMAALRMLGRAKKRNRGTILVDSSSVSTTDEIIDEESSLASVAELSIKEEDEEAGKKAEEKLLVVDRAIREGKNEMETQLIVEEWEKKWDEDNTISEL